MKTIIIVVILNLNNCDSLRISLNIIHKKKWTNILNQLILLQVLTLKEMISNLRMFLYHNNL